MGSPNRKEKQRKRTSKSARKKRRSFIVLAKFRELKEQGASASKAIHQLQSEPVVNLERMDPSTCNGYDRDNWYPYPDRSRNTFIGNKYKQRWRRDDLDVWRPNYDDDDGCDKWRDYGVSNQQSYRRYGGAPNQRSSDPYYASYGYYEDRRRPTYSFDRSRTYSDYRWMSSNNPNNRNYNRSINRRTPPYTAAATSTRTDSCIEITCTEVTQETEKENEKSNNEKPNSENEKDLPCDGTSGKEGTGIGQVENEEGKSAESKSVAVPDLLDPCADPEFLSSVIRLEGSTVMGDLPPPVVCVDVPMELNEGNDITLDSINTSSSFLNCYNQNNTETASYKGVIEKSCDKIVGQHSGKNLKSCDSESVNGQSAKQKSENENFSIKLDKTKIDCDGSKKDNDSANTDSREKSNYRCKKKDSKNSTKLSGKKVKDSELSSKRKSIDSVDTNICKIPKVGDTQKTDTNDNNNNVNKNVAKSKQSESQEKANGIGKHLKKRRKSTCDADSHSQFKDRENKSTSKKSLGEHQKSVYESEYKLTKNSVSKKANAEPQAEVVKHEQWKAFNDGSTKVAAKITCRRKTTETNTSKPNSVEQENCNEKPEKVPAKIIHRRKTDTTCTTPKKRGRRSKSVCRSNSCEFEELDRSQRAKSEGRITRAKSLELGLRCEVLPLPREYATTRNCSLSRGCSITRTVEQGPDKNKRPRGRPKKVLETDHKNKQSSGRSKKVIETDDDSDASSVSYKSSSSENSCSAKKQKLNHSYRIPKIIPNTPVTTTKLVDPRLAKYQKALPPTHSDHFTKVSYDTVPIATTNQQTNKRKDLTSKENLVAALNPESVHRSRDKKMLQEREPSSKAAECLIKEKKASLSQGSPKRLSESREKKTSAVQSRHRKSSESHEDRKTSSVDRDPPGPSKQTKVSEPHEERKTSLDREPSRHRKSSESHEEKKTTSVDRDLPGPSKQAKISESREERKTSLDREPSRHRKSSESHEEKKTTLVDRDLPGLSKQAKVSEPREERKTSLDREPSRHRKSSESHEEKKTTSVDKDLPGPPQQAKVLESHEEKKTLLDRDASTHSDDKKNKDTPSAEKKKNLVTVGEFRNKLKKMPEKRPSFTNKMDFLFGGDSDDDTFNKAMKDEPVFEQEHAATEEPSKQHYDTNNLSASGNSQQDDVTSRTCKRKLSLKGDELPYSSKKSTLPWDHALRVVSNSKDERKAQQTTSTNQENKSIEYKRSASAYQACSSNGGSSTIVAESGNLSTILQASSHIDSNNSKKLEQRRYSCTPTIDSGRINNADPRKFSMERRQSVTCPPSNVNSDTSDLKKQDHRRSVITAQAVLVSNNPDIKNLKEKPVVVAAAVLPKVAKQDRQTNLVKTLQRRSSVAEQSNDTRDLASADKPYQKSYVDHKMKRHCDKNKIGKSSSKSAIQIPPSRPEDSRITLNVTNEKNENYIVHISDKVSKSVQQQRYATTSTISTFVQETILALEVEVYETKTAHKYRQVKGEKLQKALVHKKPQSGEAHSAKQKEKKITPDNNGIEKLQKIYVHNKIETEEVCSLTQNISNPEKVCGKQSNKVKDLEIIELLSSDDEADTAKTDEIKNVESINQLMRAVFEASNLSVIATVGLPAAVEPQPPLKAQTSTVNDTVYVPVQAPVQNPTPLVQATSSDCSVQQHNISVPAEKEPASTTTIVIPPQNNQTRLPPPKNMISSSGTQEGNNTIRNLLTTNLAPSLADVCNSNQPIIANPQGLRTGVHPSTSHLPSQGLRTGIYPSTSNVQLLASNQLLPNNVTTSISNAQPSTNAVPPCHTTPTIPPSIIAVTHNDCAAAFALYISFHINLLQFTNAHYDGYRRIGLNEEVLREELYDLIMLPQNSLKRLSGKFLNYFQNHRVPEFNCKVFFRYLDYYVNEKFNFQIPARVILRVLFEVSGLMREMRLTDFTEFFYYNMYCMYFNRPLHPPVAGAQNNLVAVNQNNAVPRLQPHHGISLPPRSGPPEQNSVIVQAPQNPMTHQQRLQLNAQINDYLRLCVRREVPPQRPSQPSRRRSRTSTDKAIERQHLNQQQQRLQLQPHAGCSEGWGGAIQGSLPSQTVSTMPPAPAGHVNLPNYSSALQMLNQQLAALGRQELSNNRQTSGQPTVRWHADARSNTLQHTSLPDIDRRGPPNVTISMSQGTNAEQIRGHAVASSTFVPPIVHQANDHRHLQQLLIQPRLNEPQATFPVPNDNFRIRLPMSKPLEPPVAASTIATSNSRATVTETASVVPANNPTSSTVDSTTVSSTLESENSIKEELNTSTQGSLPSLSVPDNIIAESPSDSNGLELTSECPTSPTRFVKCEAIENEVIDVDQWFIDRLRSDGEADIPSYEVKAELISQLEITSDNLPDEPAVSDHVPPPRIASVDSGFSSPPRQIEHPEIMLDRICICSKKAELVCQCKMAIYCSRECQVNNWANHQEICLRTRKEFT